MKLTVVFGMILMIGVGVIDISYAKPSASAPVPKVSNLTPRQKLSQALIKNKSIKGVGWTANQMRVWVVHDEGKKDIGSVACIQAKNYSATPRETAGSLLILLIDYDIWELSGRKHRKILSIYRCRVSNKFEIDN